VTFLINYFLTGLAAGLETGFATGFGAGFDMAMVLSSCRLYLYPYLSNLLPFATRENISFFNLR
jgi:hypothetical protein